MGHETTTARGARGATTRHAVGFIVFLGAVSLFADITYDGARSGAGPFLAFLGATGTVVGLVAGLGELVGYGLRLVSGYLSDRTGRYWTSRSSAMPPTSWPCPPWPSPGDGRSPPPS